MKATEFCYWLQGMFELAEPETLDANQVDLIKRHLAMAFLHDIDKQAGKDSKPLAQIHNGDNGLVMRC